MSLRLLVDEDAQAKLLVSVTHQIPALMCECRMIKANKLIALLGEKVLGKEKYFAMLSVKPQVCPS